MNIATGKAETLTNLIHYIESVSQRPAIRHYENPRPGDIQHSYASVAKASRQLGFEARMDLKSGIAQLMNGMRTAETVDS